MKVCKYCNGPALYPPNTKWGGWCCSKTFYKCPGYRSKLKHTAWNKGLTSENDDRVRKITGKIKGRRLSNFHHHSLETKQRISNAMRGNNNAKHRGDRQSYYNGIRMDSSWEIKVAAFLDQKNIKWTYGEVTYILSDNRSYRPDFILECGKVIEVKGYWRKANKEKFEMWRNKYPDITCEVWDKTKLKELKVL